MINTKMTIENKIDANKENQKIFYKKAKELDSEANLSKNPYMCKRRALTLYIEAKKYEEAADLAKDLFLDNLEFPMPRKYKNLGRIAFECYVKAENFEEAEELMDNEYGYGLKIPKKMLEQYREGKRKICPKIKEEK